MHLKSSKDRLIHTPGRTHDCIRSPRLVASGPKFPTPRIIAACYIVEVAPRVGLAGCLDRNPSGCKDQSIPHYLSIYLSVHLSIHLLF